MKPRALITAADFDPLTLRVISEAFENAWHEVAPQVSRDAIEAARTTLAELVMNLARNGTLEVHALTDAAVRAVLRLPTKL